MNAATKPPDNRIWLPLVIAFILLCVIVWLDEIIGLPGILLSGPKASINWREALEETLVIIAVGFFALFKLIRAINARRRVEVELRQYQGHLEELVEKRTTELKHMLEAMSLRVVKVSDLEVEVEKLRGQLKEAGHEPMDDFIPVSENKGKQRG